MLRERERLKNRIRERETELAEVREALERFFEGTGERAVSGESTGSPRSVTWTGSSWTMSRSGPSSNRRGVLASVWQRKVKPLTDPEMPEDVRAKLEELAEESVGWQMMYRHT